MLASTSREFSRMKTTAGNVRDDVINQLVQPGTNRRVMYYDQP
ncbi:hypothetical protein PSP6_80220 [Paraburkholderia tropica]|nr:hypothetical protein PSP6_80220 [Paraburkholderia tropica]